MKKLFTKTSLFKNVPRNLIFKERFSFSKVHFSQNKEMVDLYSINKSLYDAVGRKDWNKILRVANSLKNKSLKLTRNIYNCYLSAAIQTNNFPLTKNFLEEMVLKNSLIPKEKMIVSIYTYFSWTGKKEDSQLIISITEKLAKLCDDRHLFLSYHVYERVIFFCLRHQLFEESLIYLEKMKKLYPERITENLTLEIVCIYMREGIKNTLQKIEQTKDSFSDLSILYSGLFKYITNFEKVEDTLILLEEMEKVGIELTNNQVMRIFKLICQKKKTELFSPIMKKLNKNDEIGKIIINLLDEYKSLLEKRNDFKSTLENTFYFFDNILAYLEKESNYSQKVYGILFDKMVRVCFIAQSNTHLDKIMNVIQESKYEIDPILYNTLIYGYGIQMGDLEKAKHYLEEIQIYYDVDGAICNTASKIFREFGQLHFANFWSNKSMELRQKPEQNVNVISTHIYTLAMSGKYDEAKQKFENLLKQGLSPKKIAFKGFFFIIFIIWVFYFVYIFYI